MATYWMTFRLHEATVGGRTYERRYTDLNEAVRTSCSKWWKEPTSFMAFESSSTIETLMGKFKGVIAPTHDLILMRLLDTQSALICGAVNDQDIFALIPYLKKF